MASLIDPEQFTLISSTAPPATPPQYNESVFGDYEAHSSGPRKASAVVLANSLRTRHPDHTLAITSPFQCNLLGFAGAGLAEAMLDPREGLILRTYIPPASQLNGSKGGLAGQIVFAKYVYCWKEHNYLVYIAEGFKDGSFGTTQYVAVLCEPEGMETATSQSAAADALILAASRWTEELHGEIWIFDQMFWQKNAGLWQEVQKASWEDVILNGEMKQRLQDDVEGFFDERETYERFAIPWKRGIIFYGPPGNGKTISIKAMMKTLGDRPHPVATLYVKSFSMFNPEYAIRTVFQKARSTAPCLLIFEDVDSLVTPQTRSYFLNEIDGLENNAGILMLGSTNHLERLDPGISKRPSRFDRKYLFPLPNLSERVQYSQYWRAKLSSNPEIEFPNRLCLAIAKITEDFSFAYMKEAFVAALLVLVVNRKTRSGSRWSEEDADGDDPDDLPLWREIKKQVKNLRKELDLEGGGVRSAEVR
ncbi:hypothetical protein MMC19_002235 [Ptychographa xylographoides]|nr:hypothetical protein [Ptychographa xylographoides]